MLATGSIDGVIRVWDVSRRALIASQTCGPPVKALTYTRDGQTLAAAISGGYIRVMEPLSLKPKNQWNVRGATFGQIMATDGVAFSPDGRRLASADDAVRLCDARTGEQQALFQGHGGGRVWSVAFSPDGNTLASAGTDGAIMLWDPGAKPERKKMVQLHVPASLAYSPDGKLLATASTSEVGLWETETGALRGTVERSSAEAVVGFSAEGKVLICRRSDKCVTFRDLATGKECSSDAHGPINGSTISPDRKRVGIACHDGTVQIREAGTGRCLADLHFPVSLNPTMALSPDPGFLVVHHELLFDARRRDSATGEWKPLWQLPGNNAGFAPALSADGKLLAAFIAPDLCLVDAETGKVLKALRGHVIRPPFAWVFCPDGKTLASSNVQSVIIWDLATGEEVLSFSEAGRCFEAPTFSPNGRQLAVGTYRESPPQDNSVFLYPPPPLPGEEKVDP
jgi:WD40 repeat protein